MEAKERSQPSSPITTIGRGGEFIYLKSLGFLLLYRTMHLNYCNEVIIITNSDKDSFLLFKNDNKYHKTCLKFQQRTEKEATTEINLNSSKEKNKVLLRLYFQDSCCHLCMFSKFYAIAFVNF